MGNGIQLHIYLHICMHIWCLDVSNMKPNLIRAELARVQGHLKESSYKKKNTKKQKKRGPPHNKLTRLLNRTKTNNAARLPALQLNSLHCSLLRFSLFGFSLGCNPIHFTHEKAK